MNDIGCAAARALLLDADPAELDVRFDAPLSAHLHSCDSCAAAARALLDAQDAIGAALAQLAAPPVTATPAASKRGESRMRRIVVTAAPLAAAAVLFLMLLRSDGFEPGGFEPLHGPVAHVPSTTVVNAAASGNVAVLRTADPNITIVWNLERPR